MKLRKIKLAIIMPVLNNLEYSKQAIKSIATKANARIVVIDNASTDDTTKFFKELVESGKLSLIVNSENIGVSASWNQGMDFAHDAGPPDYYLIINNDIILHPECIDNLLTFATKNHIELLSGIDIAAACVKPEDVFDFPVPDFVSLKEAPQFSCFLLKNSAVEQVGLFDQNFFPAYFEDNDYHYRLSLVGKKAFSLASAMYFHYGSRTIQEMPSVAAMSNANFLKNKAYYVEKWGGEPGKELFKYPFNKKVA